MKIKSPCIITPSLLPGVEIAGAFISIEYSDVPAENGRQRYQYQIVLPGGKEETGKDLTGAPGSSLRAGMESLLSFLSAAPSLFGKNVEKWAKNNSDEISMLGIEVEETPDCIVE